MEERRSLKRRHIMFYSRVFDRTTGKHLGYLGNMTTEGLMIISDEPIETNTSFLLRIDLPEDIYDKVVLNFEALSLWCKPDVDPNFYNTGFELSKIHLDDLRLIERLIEDYEVRE
jgi:hypothetical protein